MTPPESETHRIAVLRQDNGELQEDVVDRAIVEGSTHDGPPVPNSLYDELDADGEDSFPASDPPSHWSGMDIGTDDHGGYDDSSALTVRVVDSMPVEDVEERPDPGAPIPGTLPRPPHLH